MAPKPLLPSDLRLVISPIYTFIFLYFEPFAALSGALILHWDPARFLTAMNPILTHSQPHHVIYAQLAATYVLFALIELVLLHLALRCLRAHDALLVWRCVLGAILVCDALHLWGSWDALGARVFCDPRLWRWEDWVNLGSLWVQGGARVAFLAGYGLRSVVVGEEQQEREMKTKKVK